MADGKLNTNVGWHCALDLGRFLDLEDIRLMEYESLILDFWIAFKQVCLMIGIPLVVKIIDITTVLRVPTVSYDYKNI